MNAYEGCRAALGRLNCALEQLRESMDHVPDDARRVIELLRSEGVATEDPVYAMDAETVSVVLKAHEKLQWLDMRERALRHVNRWFDNDPKAAEWMTSETVILDREMLLRLSQDADDFDWPEVHSAHVERFVEQGGSGELRPDEPMKLTRENVTEILVSFDSYKEPNEPSAEVVAQCVERIIRDTDDSGRSPLSSEKATSILAAYWQVWEESQPRFWLSPPLPWVDDYNAGRYGEALEKMEQMPPDKLDGFLYIKMDAELLADRPLAALESAKAHRNDPSWEGDVWWRGYTRRIEAQAFRKLGRDAEAIAMLREHLEDLPSIGRIAKTSPAMRWAASEMLWVGEEVGGLLKQIADEQTEATWGDDAASVAESVVSVAEELLRACPDGLWRTVM